jgi:choline dehydrogenase-like flavoprotein
VVDGALRLLEAAPPRMRGTARLALRVLERSWVPGFSRLRLERRTRRITELESSGSMLARNLVLLLKSLCGVSYARAPEVQSVVGSVPRCELGPAAPAPPLPPHLNPAALVPPDEDESCDVVVVGSGAGGAAAARVLSEAGLDVIVLEDGEYQDALTYSRDPIDALTTLYRDGGLTACDGRPPIPLPVGRCVGGTTVINSGTCFRAPDAVLAQWHDRGGIPWATELDGEYEQLERDLAVVPVDSTRVGRNAELCRAGADALGISHGPIPRNAGGVSYCGTCPTGCALDAKRAMHVSELPRAARAGARIRAGVKVHRVLLQNGHVEGVRARRGEDGSPYSVTARAVVLAGGALGTPELLLGQGIGGRHVGRHLRVQPACWVGGRFPDQEVRGWDGVMQSWRVDEWLDRRLFLEATFTPLAFGTHWLRGAGTVWKERIERYGELAIIGVHLADQSEGAVRLDRRGNLRIRYTLTRDDAARLRFGIARAAQIHFAAGADEAYPQVGGIDALSPGRERVIEESLFSPSALRLEAFHPMGTARMGANARDSVVDPTGEVHGLQGLYVADASILPTALGANPMLTIMACARKIARGLAERLT